MKRLHSRYSFNNFKKFLSLTILLMIAIFIAQIYHFSVNILLFGICLFSLIYFIKKYRYSVRKSKKIGIYIVYGFFTLYSGIFSTATITLLVKVAVSGNTKELELLLSLL